MTTARMKEVIGDAGTYSSALLLTQFVTIAASVLSRRFLGPTRMGVWSFVQVMLSYAEYASLGTLAAITLQIPFYNGKGDAPKAESIKNTVFSFSVLTSSILAIGVLVFAFIRQKYLAPELFLGLCFTGALIILQRLNGLFISLIRAYKQFALAGRQMLFSSIVNALLIALLSYRYKLYGFLLAMCFSFLFNIFYISAYQKFNFKISMKRRELVSLIGFGVPLMVITLFTTFFETIDRLMITKYLGFEALGFYGIGLMAFNYINSIPNSISIVTIPNLQEKYGRNEEKSDLKSFLGKSDFLVSGLIAILIGLAWFVVPPLVRAILPQFVPGIRAMRFLILSTYFVAVGQAYLQFIYVIKKHLLLLPFTAISCVAAFGFNWIALRRGLGIEGVALATALAIYFNFTVNYVYASQHVSKLNEFLKNYFGVVFKFILMLAWLLLLTRFVSVGKPAVNTLLQSVLFLAAYVPFLIESNRKFQLVSIFQQKLFKRGSPDA